MPSPWPRNIVPYDEAKLRALARVEALALYLRVLDRPLDEASLPPQDAEHAAALVEVGLLRREDGALVPTNRHRRDPDADLPGRLDHKRAIVAYARTLLDETTRALDGGSHPRAAIGVVTLPDKPEVLAQATAIIAEAEDQLRALAEDAPPGERGQVRVVLFLGSTP